MNDLTILHLSDLHLFWEGTKAGYPLLHKNMIEDIKKQLQHSLDPIVIIVTGDLIDKGKYTKENICAAKALFDDLYEAIDSDNILDIFFIPGNHDKQLNDLHNQIASLLIGKTVPLPEAYESLLDVHREGFQAYNELIASIYQKYKVSTQHVNTLANTYGINVITDKNSQKKFRIISLNTSLDAIGRNQDYRNLRLGKKQLDELNKELQDNEQDVDLTIVLAHHPISWLVGKEENIIQDKMLSPSEWNANLYICGHIHQREAISYHNTHHSLTTLMTGFGWPDAGGPHADLHLYSIYVLNLDLNSMDIYVRASNDGGTFTPDFRFYGNPLDRDQNKIVYPIDRAKAHPYIDIETENGRSNKALYLNKTFVDTQQKFCQYLCSLQNKITSLQYACFDKFLNNIKESNGEYPEELIEAIKSKAILLDNDVEYTIDEMNSLNKIFDDNKDFILGLFDGFLQAICQSTITELYSVIGERATQGLIRCHFRYFERETDEYKQICCSYGNDGLGEYKQTPSHVKWNSLIKATFEAQRPLLYEANKEISQTPSEAWSNFITIIPIFTKNVCCISHQARRPFLTMGISCKSAEEDNILRLFSFVRFDSIIGAIIDNFLSAFHINISEFIDYIINQGEINDK